MIYSLGFSLAGREIKTALVSKQGKKIKLELVHSFRLDEEGVDPFKLLAPIVKGKRVKTVSGLSASDIILRDLQLPMTSQRKIIAVLPFQAETLIPFPPEETVLHPQICKKGRKASRVFLAAAKKDKISSHLDTLKALNIEPEQVSTSFHALARFAGFYGCRQPNSPYIKIAYLSRNESFFLLMEKDHILSAKLLSYPSFSLDREIKKADEFLLAKFPEAQKTPWLFAGEAPQDLSSEFSLGINERPYALAIGLALEAFAADGVQWRQGCFSPSHLRKKQNKQFFYAAAAFLLAATLAGPLGHSICSYYEDNLLKRAQTCIDRIIPGKKVRAQDLETACRALHKPMLELKKEEKLGAFSPKVSELLAWLTACTSEDDGGSQASLSSLSYLLNPDGRVQVELKLQATPALADAFAKKLRQADSLADRDSTIVWKKEKEFYYGKFFLK